MQVNNAGHMGIVILNEKEFRAGKGFVSIFMYYTYFRHNRYVLYVRFIIYYTVFGLVDASIGREGTSFN